MPLFLRRYLLAPVALLAPAALFAAAAQQPPTAPPPTTPPEDVVVVGRRDLDGQIADFVDAFTAGTRRGPLPRFERAICPTALGFSDGFKTAIVARVRKVAKAARVEVAKDKCRPNVLIIATADKKVFMEALAKNYPHFRYDMSRSAWRGLVDSTEPAVAWQSDGPMRNADGFEMAKDRDTGMAVNPTTLGGGRIFAGARPQFGAAIVIMEARALEGLSAQQIADYAAMRTLMRADPTRVTATSAPTILKVLTAPAGSEIPLSLTDWDLGALRGYYAASLNTNAVAQNGEMRSRLKRELAAPAAEVK